MWQIFCRGRISIGFSRNVTLAVILGLGWSCVRQALLAHFGNATKPKPTQSTIISMQQGKNESHDYTLRFEIVLENIPHYNESWVRNLFV